MASQYAFCLSFSFVQPVTMPSQDQTFPVGSLATLPGWGSYDNLGPVPHFPTDLMFNDNMEIVGDDECAKMYEGRRISFCDIFLVFGCVNPQSKPIQPNTLFGKKDFLELCEFSSCNGERSNRSSVDEDR